MPVIHVCSLARVEETVHRTGARTLVSLVTTATLIARPTAIAADRHLFVGISDITEAVAGHTLPNQWHVESLLDFVQRWDRSEPMVVHCYAGVSRSTAAAFIAACVLAPERQELEIAACIRKASPTATPNPLLVRLADHALGREGRMIEAVRAIGQGAECSEGVPFALALT